MADLTAALKKITGGRKNRKTKKGGSNMLIDLLKKQEGGSNLEDLTKEVQELTKRLNELTSKKPLTEEEDKELNDITSILLKKTTELNNLRQSESQQVANIEGETPIEEVNKEEIIEENIEENTGVQPVLTSQTEGETTATNLEGEKTTGGANEDLLKSTVGAVGGKRRSKKAKKSKKSKKVSKKGGKKSKKSRRSRSRSRK
jgi:hypothetical protein